MAYDRTSAYRSGDKVYGSGRNSPHEGSRLDPSGYIDRELKKRRFDRRSRLASAALQRMSGRDTKQSDSDRRRGDRNKGPNPTGPRINPNNTNKDPRNRDIEKQPGKGVRGNNKPEPETPDPFTPPKVDLNGKLIPMPWEMQMDWIQSARDLAEQNAAWDFEVGQSQLQYGNTMRDLAQQRIVDNRNVAGNNAARGMSFSSGNAQDITELANDYARAESDAGSWLQNIIGQYGVGGVQRSLAQSNFDQYAAMLQAEAARRLAERAGTLGLGQDNSYTPKPPRDKDKNDPRPGPRPTGPRTTPSSTRDRDRKRDRNRR